RTSIHPTVGQVAKPAADCQSACRHFLRIPAVYRHSISMSTFYRRRLPHYHSIGQPIFLTWRLHGSLPANRYFPEASTCGQAFVEMDRLLDDCVTGPSFLRRPEIAAMVVDSISYHANQLERYQLHAYVIMPNHVHLLITPLVAVSKITQSLKRFTAMRGNRM